MESQLSTIFHDRLVAMKLKVRSLGSSLGLVEGALAIGCYVAGRADDLVEQENIWNNPYLGNSKQKLRKH